MTEQATQTTGIAEIDEADARFATEITRQLNNGLGLHMKPGPDGEARLNAALDLVTDIAPDTAIEGMLATQMVATQNVVLSCLGNAAAADNARVVEVAVRSGTQLMRAFARQVEALGRLRGSQRTTMRVEHVQVAPDAETKLTQSVERTR